MPVPSIMIGFMLIIVFMPYCLVSRDTNFIIISGPIAMTRSYFAPPSISSFSTSVTSPFLPPAAVIRNDIQVFRGVLHLVYQYHEVGVAEA